MNLEGFVNEEDQENGRATTTAKEEDDEDEEVFCPAVRMASHTKFSWGCASGNRARPPQVW